MLWSVFTGDYMRMVSIVGARPQFIKIAPFARALARHNQRGGVPVEDVIVHTGQHYDAGMSDIFFQELELPAAAHNLGVGSGRHGSQTARMLERIEQVLVETRPDIVLTYGDTNSTVAGALAASKLHIPTAHVEAGLRSFNRRMPEEINRIVTDHVSDLLFAPTATAIENLRREGLAERTVAAGDSMHDAVLHNKAVAAQKSNVLARFGLEAGSYGVVTLHRAENTDDIVRLRQLLSALNQVAADGLALIFPVHPRTAGALKLRCQTWSPHPRLRLIEPLGYLDMINLVQNARVTLTDSGGLQKEAFFLGCPCVTLRDETEWVETVAAGGNTVVGADPSRIVAAVNAWAQRYPRGAAEFAGAAGAAFGTGDAAERILQALLAFHERTAGGVSIKQRGEGR